MPKKSSNKLTNDLVLNRILDLLKEKGKTEKEMTKYLGVSSSAFTPWKYRNSKAFMKYIDLIAIYLNVSVNYLLYGIDEEVNENNISLIEVELLKMFRKMRPDQKECIINTSKCFVSA